MLFSLQVATLLLAAVNMSLSLARALEYPGKQRLRRETYFDVQTIYYPGFTIGGACEPLALVATLLLLLSTPELTRPFWLTLAAFAWLVIEHAIYWGVTHRLNKVWLKDQSLGGTGSRFFEAGGQVSAGSDWTVLRDRWENSHLARAALAAAAFVLLVLACLRPA